MLQTMPTITTECMFAQDEIAKRIPPCVYTEIFLENLEDENPVIFDWIISFWNLIEDQTEPNPHRDMMRALMIAHMGIMYSTIKAHIEGDYLDHQYGVPRKPKPDEISVQKKKQTRRIGKNNKRENK